MAEASSITHQQWLKQSATEFNSLSGTASLDARVLLSHCLDKPLSYLLAWPDRVISSSDLVQLDSFKARRLAGEPIAYITGFREFWSMNFKVTSDVLIPRPETEILVEWALQNISSLKHDVKILELGTGSGAIAVALASENPNLHITATDISANALDIASENALSNHCPNIKFSQGSWFDCVSKVSFDLILSNPPYVAPGDPHLSEGDLPYEPMGALVASDNGLSDIQNLLLNAKNFLFSGGWVGIEHGYNQGESVREIMQVNGYHQICTIQDLADIDRITVGQWRDNNE